MLDDMNAERTVSWQFLRGVLPYPDLRRRWLVRRRALKLVTCKQWPGRDATGMEAAQLALLRLLWLQQLIRSAASERRGEDAALLSRASLETCIVGLYCVHSGDAIAHLSAANHGAAGRIVSYLNDAGLGSTAAIDSAVEALGEVGPDLNIRDLAQWLEREHDLVVAAWLYQAYYVPLSHLFTHSYAFALMRHVRPDGSLRRSPGFPWTRRSAVRMADGCVGLLAANIAHRAGRAPQPFLRYATAHLDRLLTPAFVFTVKGALKSAPWRKMPAALRAISDTRSYSDGASRVEAPAQPHAPVHDGLASFLDPWIPEAPDGLFTQPMTEYLADVLAEMNGPAYDAQQPRYRRPGTAG